MRIRATPTTERRTRRAAPPALTVTGAGPEISVPASALTLSGFRAWAVSAEFPTRGRLAYLGGTVLIDMSPEEINTHALVKVAVCNKLHQLAEKEELGVLLPDRVLITNDDAELSTEPDGSFLSYARVESGAVRLVPRANEADQFLEVRGSPDWVLEIVSASSVTKDAVDLRGRYFAADIPEYWLIDARGEDIAFTILVAGEEGYVPVEQVKGWQRSAVFGRRFRLTRQRDRLELWRYTLHARK